MRWLSTLFFVLTLGVMGCETTVDGGSGGSAGDGGSGGDGGTGGSVACEGNVCPCTEAGIRAAIDAGGEDPYTFNCDGPQTVVVTGSPIEIDNDVILDGQGNLTLDGSEVQVVEENSSVFLVPTPVKSELRGIKVINGRDPDGGIVVSPFPYRDTTLTLLNSTVSGNSGNGISNFLGGMLILVNSTVSGNSGFGILSSDRLMLINSTVSGNSSGDGGGIRSFGEATLLNSTVSGNSPTGIDARCLPADDCTLTAANSLVADDCVGSTSSAGYNIESDGDTCGFDQTGDQAGVSAALLDLQPLANNGGPTQTHAITTDSAAFNAGTCEVDEDQRGVSRPQGPACDVGAFELEVGP
ncbi:MAG: right-handed parallel beta-helix repeat-containing protein [Deltaproteobacteria bacterium]|nr:right-handed parallel beta-helix repeat-containing protein [Deltaproteobacteria bacterium]NND28115.1 hypothetical protein [Myxococcales bacterium]MBT8465284.1 right-handed parallel beta-helix repeat-containing protein [Deltaproteobacteria bacterium]MBT8481574.1 right-handed parallel beta-helix repeat-containing protein [Deltaproteobacteria bacterium]NNK07177.1 hypothetical protein [Myxococcales bacterium]